ncbi:GrpE protein [Coniochaeta ligniaria NRRL 30616]|uniref:GrpE protein homolog n=1 Tax=Coniochaeta ligniaria NRRL 30616 TaxID=1408157 RepID=A0A1J7IIP6_9PEZI|nr:GrpE protein [Coniochaeta ligniaria NRRL 30616]
MLRQALSAPSRAARSSLRIATQARLSRPQLYQIPSIATRATQPSVARWYSAEAVKEGEALATDIEAALKKQLEQKEAEIKDWKDKFMRSVADFRNLQDRTQREVKSAKDYAIQKFAKDLVDSVDNLDRALAQVPEEKLKAVEKSEHLQDLVNLYDGLKLTENILMQTLKKHGLERFDPSGEKFNPNEHEATFMTPMPDKDDNIVIHTQQKGFRLNGRVLRAAKVGVVKNK